MPTFHFKLIKQVYIYALIFVLIPAAAMAQETGSVDILPARTLSDDVMMTDNGDATHPTVRLTPDRSELIRLDREAGTIVIGNPDHLSVLVDTSKTLVLVPKLPGATHFTALDGKGNVIMQRHVIVAAPKEHYVRVRRSCAGNDDEGCQDTSVFYCPDMCHRVKVVSEEKAESSSSPFDALEELAESAASRNGGGDNRGTEE